MSKFKEGDLIIGNKEADKEYNITRAGVICKVMALQDDSDLEVRIIKSPQPDVNPAYFERTWVVNDEYFDLYESNNMEYTFTTEEYKEFKSAGKGSHKGYTVDKIKTIVTMNGKTGVAVINKEDYNERQGILEALGNMMYGNFDREYDKLQHKRKMVYKADCKCSICGVYKDTPEDARACELAHDERRRKKFDAYVLRKEAIKRIKEADKEHKIEEIMAEIYEKRKKDKKSSETEKPVKQKKPDRRKKDINSDES